MFYLITFIDFCKYIVTLNLMAATHLKQVGTGATNDQESCGMLKKRLFGTFHG